MHVVATVTKLARISNIQLADMISYRTGASALRDASALTLQMRERGAWVSAVGSA
jgi:hypothetical protein